MGFLRASFEPKKSKIKQETEELWPFTKEGCVTQVSIMWDVWDSLGLHLNQQNLKSGKKWLSNGQLTKGKLRDSSEYHAKCMRASFEPNISKIGKEAAELWPIY